MIIIALAYTQLGLEDTAPTPLIGVKEEFQQLQLAMTVLQGLKHTHVPLNNTIVIGHVWKSRCALKIN